MSEHTEVGSIVADSTTTTPSVQVYQKGDKIGGQYLVHEVIRDGGMGDVYFCFNIYTDQPYALKTFKPKYWANEKIRQLFEQEIRTWVVLEKHPNIVRCHYLDTLDDLPFMVLEWVADPQRERVDLRHWLKQHGALDLRLALNVAIDVCHGLSHAQQKQPGLVHRDLKPANILLTTDLTAKITDFGLATLSQAAQLGLNELLEDLGSSASLVQLGSFVGTPDYAAPEQWHGGVVDSRADIYALGCLLYEMVTGQRPFKVDLSRQDRTAWLEAWYMAHVTSPLPSLPATLPSALQEVIHSCLQKEPAQRLVEVDVLLGQLEQIYQQQFGETRSQPVVEKFGVMDYFFRARTYSKLNDFEKAMSDYNEAIQLNPNLIPAYNHRGKIYAKKGDYNQAIADYSEVIPLDPNDDPYSQRIVYAIQAIVYYREAIRLDPNDATAYYNRGIAYDDKGDSDQALADFNEAIRLAPNLMSSYEHRGDIYARRKDYDQAIADYNQIIQFNPNDGGIYIKRGKVYADKKDYDQAIADYNKAIQLNPELLDAYYRRGWLYISMKDHDNIIMNYSELIQINPELDFAYYLRGNAYAAKEYYDQAIADYSETFRFDLEDNDTFNSYYGRGLAYFNKGNYDQAIADFNEAIGFNPGDADTYTHRGMAYAKKGNYDQAIADYTSAIWFNSQIISLYNKHNKSDQVITWFNSQNSFTYKNRGEVYAKQGKHDQAIADYRKSLGIDPDQPDILKNLGLCLMAINQMSEAKEQFRQAIELDPSLADELAQLLDA